MKLFSANLELAALRSIMSGNDRVMGALLPRLTVDSFNLEYTREAFILSQTLHRRHGEMPRWRDILENQQISEDSREELAYREVDPARTRSEVESLVQGLEKYRKARTIWKASRRAQEVLAGTSVDLDQLTDELSEILTGTRGTVNLHDHTTIVGGKKCDIGILNEALTETEKEFIPTGIRAFDSIAGGVPRGVSWVIAGTTSGGKSVMLMQIAMHMARMGAKCVLVSLEMNRKIVVRRMLSHLSGVPLTRINMAHKLDEPTVRLLRRCWNDFHEQVRKNGGRLRIVSPPEDVSMDEILATYRPTGPDLLGVDYLGLTKGMDSEDQWRKMSAAVRTCTTMAAADNNIIALLCQLSAEGMIRYSKGIMEHARLAWTWSYVDEAVRESKILTVRQPKSTNIAGIDFHLVENFPVMRFEDLDARGKQQVDEERRNRAAKKGGKGRPVPPRAEESTTPRAPFRQEVFSL